MLRSLKDLESSKVHATDGDIGKVTDFLFDDQHWTIRYLDTDTGGFWKSSGRVLISPISFRQADWATRKFHLALTQEKVRNSPSIDMDKPVSRQYERDYSQYYGWPYYWGFGETMAWGVGIYPGSLAELTAEDELGRDRAEIGDPHLRSAKEVAGYHVHGSNGAIGHIADFIVQSGRALVVAVNKWDGLDAYTREQTRVILQRKLKFLDFARFHFISARDNIGLPAVFRSVDAAYAAATTKMSTPRLARVLADAVARQAPAKHGVFRPKPRYAHQGGSNPPIIVVHGNAVDQITDSYRRYLEHTFREAFKLQGTPLRIQFVTAKNPFADKDKK